MNADKIHQSPKIMRAMNLYADVERTRLERQLCRQTIYVWQVAWKKTESEGQPLIVHDIVS